MYEIRIQIVKILDNVEKYPVIHVLWLIINIRLFDYYRIIINLF